MSRSFGVSSLTTRPPIEQLAARDVLQPGDHAQRGRLAAAGRADEDEELPVVDLERQVEDRLDAVVVDLVDFVERTSATAYLLVASLQTWNAGPSPGRTAGPSTHRRVAP